ncbi:MAG: LysR family transcriptional regulator [Micropruina sp.]|nr:MAG: LysR family transcriptional regulator [Micropruina sp.]
MELRTIRYFVAVADAGSVTGATRTLHVSQPSLSRQLHQLERELGLDLFTRRDSRLVLTPGGREFLPAARELLARAEAAKAAAQGIRSGGLSTLTVAAPEVTLNDVLAPFFATFTAADPMPRVTELDPSDEYEVLEAGADLVIGTRPAPERCASREVARLPVYAHVPAGHPLDGPFVGLPALVTQDLLVLPAPAHSRRALDQALDAARLPYGRVTEFASSRVAQAVAAAGRGVAVVSDDPRFGLRAVPVRTATGVLEITLFAAWLPGHHAATQIDELAGRLRAFVQARYGA